MAYDLENTLQGTLQQTLQAPPDEPFPPLGPAGLFTFNNTAEVDYATRDANLTGAADSKKGTVAFAMENHGFTTTGLRYLFYAPTAAGECFFIRINSAERVAIRAANAANISLFVTLGAVGIQPADGLVHYVGSWDVALGVNPMLWYRDGVIDTTPVVTDLPAGYGSATDWSLGAQDDGIGPIPADLKYLAFWPGTYVDLTANLDWFYDGGYVDLGPDGTATGMPTPTFYVNADYQSLAKMRAPLQNLGMGGDFPTVNGTIT